MAAGYLDGGDDLFHRHAEPGHRHGAHRRCEPELGVVGLPDHRDVHGLLLREAVAPLEGVHRHRILRAALFGKDRRFFARVPGALPGRLLQRDDHGDRHAGGDQDRRHPAGRGQVHDRTDRRDGDGGLLGDVGAVGRGRHRPLAVRHRHGGSGGRRLLRAVAAGGGRSGGSGDASGAEREAGAAARLHRLAGSGADLHRPDRRAVVEHLVPRGGARRWRLCGAADAGGAERERGDARDAVVQRRALRVAAVAVDPGGAGLADRLPQPRFDYSALPESRPVDRAPRSGLSGDARVSAARAVGTRGRLAGGGLHVDDQHAPELGRVVRGRRFLSPVRGAGA